MAPRRRLPSANPLPPANDLLAALPALDYARPVPALSTRALTLKRVLHRPGEPFSRR